MGRRRCCRKVQTDFAVRLFKPCGVPEHVLRGVMVLAEDLEAMRLVDGLGLTQEAAAQQLGVSKATICRMVGMARAQIVRALTEGMAIGIGSVEQIGNGANAAPLRAQKGNGCCRWRRLCEEEVALKQEANVPGQKEVEVKDGAEDGGSAVEMDPVPAPPKATHGKESSLERPSSSQ